MLDSVKSDNFLNTSRSSTSGLSGTEFSDTVSTLEAVGQLGRNFVPGLPTPATLELNSVAAPAVNTSAGTFAKQTLATDISQSLARESQTWQGGLLGIEAAPQQALPQRSARQRSTQSTLTQGQLNNAVGAFRVGASGKVKVDFLFDGDRREGELALFNLAGMSGLNRREFAKEAARRALSGGQNGRIVIKDQIQGAQFGGRLGEKSRSKGRAAATQTVSWRPGTRFGVMLVSNGTVAAARAGKATTLFSIAEMNPQGKTQIGKAAKNVYGMEASLFRNANADFNDVVFSINGASGKVTHLSRLLSPSKNWLKDADQPFLKAPKFTPTPGPIDPPKPIPPTPVSPKPPVVSPPRQGVISDISTNVSKFNPGSSESQIIASGAQKIVLGSQRIYIGTQQVSSINQNPIMRSFDSKNPKNNWTRTDIEKTGADGRGLGLLWSGKGLYGIFSVDGTQGTPSQDFRRATSGVQQNWLKSYGPGGGAKIAVIGQIDPSTGKLLKAAHLSAVLSSGKTNSLAVTDATVNRAGNIVIKAKSFFSPRRPDGRAMTRNPGDKSGSPFDYTLEITPDLTKVVRTSAKGWS